VLEHEKLLVEPATSCSVAALLDNKELYRGKRVLLVICGGNVSLQQAETWRSQYLTATE
jgi:threonine dehydratase